MSERISAAELAAIAEEAQRNIRGGDSLLLRLRLAEDPRRRNLIDLVDEIHRLRGVILSSARVVEGDGGKHEDLSRYFDALMTEAVAIRKEIR